MKKYLSLLGVGDGTLFDQIMEMPLHQIYGAVWRSDIIEVRRRSSGIQDVRGRTPPAHGNGEWRPA
jgi:hypothetical protein